MLQYTQTYSNGSDGPQSSSTPEPATNPGVLHYQTAAVGTREPIGPYSAQATPTSEYGVYPPASARSGSFPDSMRNAPPTYVTQPGSAGSAGMLIRLV